jgi:ribosomal protein L11 methyltransferase
VVKWAKVTVRATTEAAEGMIEVLCRLAGGAQHERLGGALVLQAHVPVRSGPRVVEALRERMQALRKAGIKTTGTRIDCKIVGGEKWEDAWRKSWGAQRFEGGIVVTPSWVQYRPRPGEKVLVLDPGLAFGTGQHATTRMCLNALAQLVKPGDRVADVGCGSGILALAAARSGARRVLASDSDPQALRVARRNVARNRLGGRVVVREGDLLDGVRAKFDLIAANIGPVQVSAMARSAARRLSEGGALVASGIPRRGLRAVRVALAEAGLSTTQVLREGDWVTVICRKKCGA